MHDPTQKNMKRTRSKWRLRKAAILLLAVIALGSGCGSHESEKAKAPEKNGEKGAEPESRVTHGTNGEAVITLDTETQKRMGLQVAALSAAELAPEASGFARVQDMSWVGTTITDLQAAQIATDAAKQELTRLKTLREQNNASEKALQAAETAAAKEENNLRAIRVKVQAAWGKKLADLIASYASAGASAANPDPLPMQLFDLKVVLVRADFPPGAGKLAPEADAKFFTLAENAPPIPGKFFDYAPSADPQTQSRGIFYVAENGSRQLAPGLSLKAATATSEPPRSGVLVPREAILRAEGASWVYLQIGPDKFTRRQIAPDQITDQGWLVIEGLKPQERAVTAAAQELLSEELKEQ